MIGDIISKIRPGAEWTCGETYESLVWLDQTQIKPTEEEILVEIMRAHRKIVDEHRLAKFQTEVLVLLVKLFKSATYVNQGGGKVAIFNTAELQEARDKIAEIEAALPYLE